VLALWAYRDLADVRVSVGDLKGAAGVVPSAAVDVRAVKSYVKQGKSRWGTYHEGLTEVPLVLQERDSVSVQQGHNQAFWLTVHVPEEAAAGTYEGAVRIEAAGSEAFEIPYRVTVRDFSLAQPTGVVLAMYERLRADPAWIAAAMADMRAHGMTSVALMGDSGLRLSRNGNNVAIAWDGSSALERNLDEYAKAGFTEPMCWLMGEDLTDFCLRSGPIGSPAFGEAYRQAIAGIVQHGKAERWPEIIFQPLDEPLGNARRRAELQRLLGIIRSVPGARTEENGINGWTATFPSDVYPLLDILTYHDGPVVQRGAVDLNAWSAVARKAAADGKQLWFYNVDVTGWRPEPVRFMYGFGLHKAGVQGIVNWSYMYPVDDRDPGAIYRFPTARIFRYPAAGGELGGPTTGWEGTREGVDDYRYLLTLRQLVDEARRQGKRAVADKTWAPVQARLDAATFNACRGPSAQGDWTGKCETQRDGTLIVRGDVKIDNGWSFEDYDLLRETVAQGIDALQTALGR
jgi:hypothetical protein